MASQQRILIVDDDSMLAEALADVVREEGYEARTAADSAGALSVVRHGPVALALVDLRLGEESGLDLIPRLRDVCPEIAVVVITALGTIETAVAAMHLGADNFITKPIEAPHLLAIMEKALETGTLRRRKQQLERLSRPGGPALVGDAPLMREALDLAAAVAARDTTVLLLGETGTGKGMVARRIHDLSSRAKAAFVELNCAGLQRELTESELFGHERGAFTGAISRKLGLIEAAEGGTLLLDEIGEMDMAVQAKLLKVLEQRQFRRVGGLAEIHSDIRVIAATHRDLAGQIAAGSFREDLFYRLNVFAIALPPLRQRREDILPLATHFLREFQRGCPGATEAISPEAADELLSYSWPGNVRELRNVMERASILCPPDCHVSVEHLPPLIDVAAPSANPATIEESEQQVIERALAANDGNIKAAACELGIARGTLYRKIKKYGITGTSG